MVHGMERYIALEVFEETHQANLVCARLESRGVPVMVEHIKIPAPGSQDLAREPGQSSAVGQMDGSLHHPGGAQLRPEYSQYSTPRETADRTSTTAFRVLVPESASQLAYGVLAGIAIAGQPRS